MSYQVLARKWRPKTFLQLMGQEHVVTVLVNALEQKRLHHAYLFTGTRGVGKTTIARIFAKSLNCDTGITSAPCGTCETCLDIDQGRFIDLLEIDAASRTKVDDTREILDNVQYAPTRGRYKVYLIDEVHMLSKSSFNALLKTLEEPPEHVKFILATTDPQKLPVTVISRCLQFHLKALTVVQIEQQLKLILAAENVPYDAGSLTLLAKAARGSMRDALSLTDQGIAQGKGTLTLVNIQQMLGGVDQNWVYKILIALVKHDAEQLMTLSLDIASYGPNYSRLMAELIQLLHQIAMVQIIPRHFDLSPEHSQLLQKFAQGMSPEDVQLYYQIVLTGRKDLPYAADEQAAFDMVLLRLLAFTPITNASEVILSEIVNQPAKDIAFDESLLPAEQVEQSLPVLDGVSAAEGDNKTVLPTPSQGHIAQNNVSNDEGVENNQVVATQTKIPSLETEKQLSAELHDFELAAITQVHNPTIEQVETNQHHDFSQNVGLSEQSILSSPLGEIEPDEPGAQAINPVQDLPDMSQPPKNSVAATSVTGLSVNETADIPQQSVIQSAIATRNMLRSRKKAQEKNTKKPNDAVLRPIPETQQESNQISLNERPKIEDIPAHPFNIDVIDPAKITLASQVDRWANMIDSMALSGRLRQLAIHATICESSTDALLVLLLDQATKHLKTDVAHIQLQEQISQFLSRPVVVNINIVEQTAADPYQIQAHINDKRYEYACELIKEDPIVEALQKDFNASLDEKTIVAC